MRFGQGRLAISEGETIRQIDLASLSADARGYVLSAEETFDPPTSPLDENGQGIPYAVFGFGAHMAEVEVDTALGTVKVLKITAALLCAPESINACPGNPDPVPKN